MVLLGAALPAPAQDLISQAAAPHAAAHGLETQLIKVLDDIAASRIDQALAGLEQVVRDKPEFRLAQLIYGDLLLAKSRPITDFGNLSYAPGATVDALRAEAMARWRHYLLPPQDGRVPAELIMLSPEQRYTVVVDLKASRLFLFENREGVPRLLHDFYVTIGKNGVGKLAEGDQKTPIGVYFVTGFIPPDKLPDFYGYGAFPIDYPNPWDMRHGRTGYGIWLHGTPQNTYSRPPRDSDGCVILNNQDLGMLAPYLQAGVTPVILSEEIQWVAPDRLGEQRQRFARLLEQWRSDWESRNADRYLSHYSRDYAGLGMDYRSWVEHKRRVNPAKRFIKVELDDTSMFLYPGDPDMLVVTFVQDYRSDNFARRFKKRQYWRRESDGRWRIIYEGSVS